jgi:hypothetical protein
MIFASTDAKFGFPEITLATIPGAGGSQRLTKTVGKQKVRVRICVSLLLEAVNLLTDWPGDGDDINRAASNRRRHGASWAGSTSHSSGSGCPERGVEDRTDNPYAFSPRSQTCQAGR